ncbi:hypothetical protein GQ53DRAFT_134919 [Thozetella sp. PMI_491]|nr:hypothetical protein GQ53DRAFT_134919 [Thozetella sp. PMI_491]
MTAGVGKPQLRTACDPCSAAKVGCDKNHPACKRCLQMSVQCSYSESRKHGKQALRRKLAQDRVKCAANATTANAIAGLNGQSGQELLPRTAAAPNTGTVPLAVPVGGGGDGGWNPLLISPLSPLPPATSLLLAQEPLQSLSSADASALFPQWTFDDSVTTTVDMNFFGNWNMASLSPSAPSHPPLGARGQQQRLQNLLVSEPNKEIGTSSGAIEDEIACVTATRSSSRTTSAHDCETQAISILLSLQHGEVVPGMTSCSLDPVHCTQFNLMPRFDRVLSTNRAALDGWINLMRCSCVQCPHLTLLYVSVLTKMLFWYRIAANERAGGRHDGNNSSGSSSSSSSSGSDSGTTTPSLSPPTVDQFGVQTTVIKVGLFGLDTEDQANLRRFLLMRELRRMERAIDELMNVDRTAMKESAGQEAWRGVQWSLDGVLRVRDELRDVIENLSKGLSF